MACRIRLTGVYNASTLEIVASAPLTSFFHPQWTPGIGHLRQCDFSVKLLRPRKGPFAAEQDDPLPPFDDPTDDDSSALDPSALAEPDDRPETCNVRLSICYSPSYGVPVLWLEAHKRGPPASFSSPRIQSGN
jgi:hypothetical protein